LGFFFVANVASVCSCGTFFAALTQAGQDAIVFLLKDATQTDAQLLDGVPKSDLAAFYRVIDHLHGVPDQDPKAKLRPKPVAKDNYLS